MNAIDNLKDKLDLERLKNKKLQEKVDMLESAIFQMEKTILGLADKETLVRIPTESFYNVIKKQFDEITDESYEESLKIGWRHLYCEFGFCAAVHNDLFPAIKEMVDEIDESLATPEYVGM